MTKLLTSGRRLGTGGVRQLDDVVISMRHFLKWISEYYHPLFIPSLKNIARKYFYLLVIRYVAHSLFSIT